MTSIETELPGRPRWIMFAMLVIGLSLLGWFNLNFYFHDYYADPASLRSSAYRSAQQNYEIQAAQSRYQASLGPGYQVFTVGQRLPPYDPVITGYLVTGQQWTMLSNPEAQLPSIAVESKGLAFVFFPGNEQYRELAHNLIQAAWMAKWRLSAVSICSTHTCSPENKRSINNTGKLSCCCSGRPVASPLSLLLLTLRGPPTGPWLQRLRRSSIRSKLDRTISNE